MYLLTYAFIFLFISLLYCFSFFFLALLIAQFTAGFVYSRTLSIRSKMAEEISLNACLCVGFVFFCIKLSHFHSDILDLRKLPVIIYQYIQSLPNRFSSYKRDLSPIFSNNFVDSCLISSK